MRLADFLSVVSAAENEPAAARVAVEQAARALDAPIVAIVREGAVEASAGRHAASLRVEQLKAVAAGTSATITVPGMGPWPAVSVPLGDPRRNFLVAARSIGFDADEAVLLGSMAHVLALTQRMLCVLDVERSLREESELQGAEKLALLSDLKGRQNLLERLSDIQRAIVHRAAPQEVLDAIVTGASAHLGSDVAFIRFVEADDPSSMVIAASTGMSPAILEMTRRQPVGRGASGAAIATGLPVVINAYQSDPRANVASAAVGVTAAVAAPVHRQGQVVGSLTVGTYMPGHCYPDADRDAVLAFAEYASIALTDAAMVDEALHRASHDPLTGLPNRALFHERLDHALAVGKRGQPNVYMLFLDLDGFKTVNDSLGHAAGDELLMAVSDRLVACLRPGDTVARFGGDEFAILLERAGGVATAASVAARVLSDLEAPFAIAGREVPVTASIGIALGICSGDEVLRNADLAMYRAKGRGRGSYEVFAPEMHAEVVDRIELEADLRLAVEGEQFLLQYQPIVDLGTGEVMCVEALVRWHHPLRGVLLPAAFIPLAEETRAIRDIGRWVLGKACRQAATWRTEHGRVAVSVNLSSPQLQYGDIVADVAAVLAESGLDPGDLVLEITETVLMRDIDATVETLRGLKRLGVRLAVDDFGTGHSSLQYLGDFSLDWLKMAKPFVDGLRDDAPGHALARVIVDLGESLGLTVVAEGVEADDQQERLVQLGCRYGQGLLLAPPADPQAIGDLLGRRAASLAGR